MQIFSYTGETTAGCYAEGTRTLVLFIRRIDPDSFRDDTCVEGIGTRIE